MSNILKLILIFLFPHYLLFPFFESPYNLSPSLLPSHPSANLSLSPSPIFGFLSFLPLGAFPQENSGLLVWSWQLAAIVQCKDLWVLTSSCPPPPQLFPFSFLLVILLPHLSVLPPPPTPPTNQSSFYMPPILFTSFILPSFSTTEQLTLFTSLIHIIPQQPDEVGLSKNV